MLSRAISEDDVEKSRCLGLLSFEYCAAAVAAGRKCPEGALDAIILSLRTRFEESSSEDEVEEWVEMLMTETCPKKPHDVRFSRLVHIGYAQIAKELNNRGENKLSRRAVHMHVACAKILSCQVSRKLETLERHLGLKSGKLGSCSREPSNVNIDDSPGPHRFH